MALDPAVSVGIKPTGSLDYKHNPSLVGFEVPDTRLISARSLLTNGRLFDALAVSDDIEPVSSRYRF